MSSHREYSGTSTPYSDSLNLTLNRASTVTESNVSYADFTGNVRGHTQGSSIDTVISRLSNKHPALKKHLAEARMRGAKTLFAEEKGLRALRLRAGLSQADLAVACGTTQPYIARYESGSTVPLLTSAKKMAAVLGCSLDELTDAFDTGEK